MADGSIDIAFGSYQYSFNVFTDSTLPGMRQSQATLEYSSFGVGYLSGPAVAQKRMWTISAVIPADERQDLEDLFEAWDSLRATGSKDAVVTLIDGLIASSSTVYNTVFTEPPSYSTYRGRSRYLIVTTVLMEI